MFFRLASLLLLCVTPQLKHTQKRQYNIINFNIDNGLPQNGVTSIQFDRKGYCWLGTQKGLVRFDGRQFKVFDSYNIKGLRSDRIYNITRDTAGTLFASTGGIIDILQINDTLPQIAATPFLIKKTGHDFPSRGVVTTHSYADCFKSIPNYEIVCGTATGNIYLVQPDESYHITPHKKSPISFKDRFQDRQILLVNNNLVILSAYNKVLAWREAAPIPHPILRGPLWDNPDFVKGNYTTPFNTDCAYIYAGKTLYQLSLRNDTLSSEALLDDLNIPAMTSVYFDKRNNDFYIGSAVSGLFIVRPAGFYSPPSPTSSIGQDYYSQAVTEEGIICQRFLFRADGSYREYPISRNLKPTLYQPETHTLYYAPQLELLRLDVRTGRPVIITPLATPLSSIFPEPGAGGRLLFSTSFSMGKIINNKITEEKTIEGLKKGQELFAAYPLGIDTFLLATWSGVKWYDYRNNKIYRSILDSLPVRQLHVSSSKHIWIASYGKGWYAYNKGTIVKMPDGPQDALNTVNAMVDDGRGFFWLSSNNGLFKVSKQALIDYADHKSETVYFYKFSTQDRLPTNEFNACNPSYVWLRDSMLSLPSIKGLVWFYPHHIHVTLPDNGIYMDPLITNQTKTANGGGKLNLAPDHARINIKVSSPYFGNKENMQLQFRIEGLDEEWRVVPENGEITLDRMPAGAYSLVVRKLAGMEQEQYTQLVLPIQVRPFWYHTVLFYIILFLLSVALIFWVVKLRTRLLRTRNRKLKTQVALQTRDLNRMVHQLTQSEEALKESNRTKDNIITTVLHDLRSPIRFIYSISKHIANDHRKIKQENLDLHLQELKNSTASLNSFTDQFFTWAISQHGNFSAKYSDEALDDICLETESLYADIMSANGNKLTVVQTGLSCHTDPQLLSAIIRNLLDNANKNTRNGHILIDAVHREDKIIITVRDTGKGFTAEALAVFLSKDKTNANGGRGSFIIRYLLELIDGELEAVSRPGEGTEFRVILHHQGSGHVSRQDGSVLSPTAHSALQMPGL